MTDKLDEIGFYQLSMSLWDECWDDASILMKDSRGKEISNQLIRAVGSISANIEEGYGRGYGKEYPQFLRISRGSAREARGWHKRSNKLLDTITLDAREKKLSSIIAMLSKSIQTLEEKKKIKLQ